MKFESVPEVKEWVICSMHTLVIKYYDAKYRIKSENYFFLSSQVFYIALFLAVLNWQILANPENRGQCYGLLNKGPLTIKSVSSPKNWNQISCYSVRF